jgi:hypothetical protein
VRFEKDLQKVQRFVSRAREAAGQGASVGA